MRGPARELESALPAMLVPRALQRPGGEPALNGGYGAAQGWVHHDLGSAGAEEHPRVWDPPCTSRPAADAVSTFGLISLHIVLELQQPASPNPSSSGDAAADNFSLPHD